MMVYGLIGASLSHSFSQRWFTEKFQREGLAHHRYDLFPMAHVEALHELIRDTNGLSGLNVTIPYKQAVMPLLDELDGMATAVGAVNTIVLREGRTIGHNTDVEGFRESLLKVLGQERPRALVLGSGGASRAVAFVLRELGIRFRVVSRSPERGDLTWDLLDPIIVKVSPLIVNTTPLGMYPDVEGLPALPFEAIGPKHLLYDLIYNPAETGFLKEGKDRGARTLNGLHMLEAQAEASWRLWQQR